MRGVDIGIGIGIIAVLVGCAGTASPSRWERADGSPFTAEQLEKDKMDCFPSTPQMGPQSMGLEEARDCMYRKGWRRTSS